MMNTLLIAVIPFSLGLILTELIKRYARLRGIVDRPDEDPSRKFQRPPVPLLGGLAIYIALVMAVFLVVAVKPSLLLGGYLLPKHLIGIAVGGLFLVIGGYRDDRAPQRPLVQFLWPVLASLAIIASGIGITYLTNPFGEALRLDQAIINFFTVNDTTYKFIVIADVFAFVWLLGSVYTTKFLDGLDGLVSGITVIGMVILFFLSKLPQVGQPETAVLALIIASVTAGFWVQNMYPAKIFLGEGGAMLTGFLLGTLAIISGGKIATALLILGIPILDVVWVIIRRVFIEHRSPFRGDRKHLHFRLLDLGLSQWQAVLLLYACTAVFGAATLFVSGPAKLIALGVVAVLMLLLVVLFSLRSRRRV